jgi:EpsI family protein
VLISQDVRDILGPGDFLLRVYQDQSGSNPYVDLFVAYFPSQRAGDTIHSPKHCLPGAGWTPVESSKITLSLPGQPLFPANRYVIAKGAERQLVIYWYWAPTAGSPANTGKFYLVADAMRMNRSDGSLIRVTTPMHPGENPDLAQQRLVSFARNLFPPLHQYIPQ